MKVIDGPHHYGAHRVTRNCEWLLEADVVRKFLAEPLDHKELRGLFSDEHFSVDGTRIAEWASMKSFKAKDGSNDPPVSGRNGERRDRHRLCVRP
jgi:hypothetical protein